MGRAAGVSRRRKKTKGYRLPSKKQAAKAKKRRLKKNKVTFPIVKKAYDDKQSLRKNFVNMGLVDDPNRMFKTPRPVETILPEFTARKDDDDEEEEDEEEIMEEEEPSTSEKSNNRKRTVVEKLEKLANPPVEKQFRLTKEQMRLAIYMMEKHGEDYEAMQRDRRNRYQLSAGTIRKYIKKLKKIPYCWNVYLAAKEMATEAAQKK